MLISNAKLFIMKSVCDRHSVDLALKCLMLGATIPLGLRFYLAPNTLVSKNWI